MGGEGTVGMPVFLGAKQMASKTFAQVQGKGVRMGAEAFRSVIGHCGLLPVS